MRLDTDGGARSPVLLRIVPIFSQDWETYGCRLPFAKHNSEMEIPSRKVGVVGIDFAPLLGVSRRKEKTFCNKVSYERVHSPFRSASLDSLN